MADLKINEDDYFYFLNKTKTLLEKLDLKEENQEEKNFLLKYIEEQYTVRSMMAERKLYYDFYMQNKKTNQEAANMAYQKYIEIKQTLDERKGRA